MAQAQTLIGFTTANQLTGTVAGTPGTNIASGTLSRGSGITATSAANSLNSNGWDTTSLGLAISGNDYYSFTVVPASGFKMSITGITIRPQRSNTGPANLVVLSDNAGFGFTASAPTLYTTTTVPTSAADATFTVTGHNDLTGAVEFRIYGWGASAGTGTLRVQNATAAPNYAITVTGTTAPSNITTGTCCVGTTCSIVADAAACTTAGGTNFVAGFATCPPTACQPPAPGACCVGTTCVLAADLAACTSQGGTNFNATQTTCTGVTCTITTGACCAAGGGCTIVANAAACTGGTFIAGVAGSTCPANSCPTAAAPGDVVFSQVYGGGGNNGATFNADFAELFNRTAAPINVSGWSIQYFSAGGGAGGRVTLPSGTIIPSRQYLLVKIGSAGSTGAPVSFDVDSSAIAASATDGRLVLVSNATPLAAGCPTSDPSVVDLIGYGTATCFEGSAAAPAGSATTALFRSDNGCTDTNNNASNFAAGTPAPRNLASPAAVCGGGVAATGTDSTAVASACAGSSVIFSVTVTPGSNAVITGVTADFTSIGGSAGVAMTPDAGNPLIFRSTQQITLAPNTTGVTLGDKNIPVS
ncbi:MAG: lamin tail domain-containing protein, partial [Phycisphaerales bacterium]|nr:lamin tail domain-containing protein [Phycisphaerales bacterium]